MLRIFCLLLLLSTFNVFTSATSQQARLIRVKTKQHHHVTRHHAHKAVKHHAPKHQHTA